MTDILVKDRGDGHVVVTIITTNAEMAALKPLLGISESTDKAFGAATQPYCVECMEGPKVNVDIPIGDSLGLWASGACFNLGLSGFYRKVQPGTC